MIAEPIERGAPETGSARVVVVIPCRAEYVAIARLAILGVASRLSYTYDEVEDVRLAVGEACTHAVERAHAAGLDSSSGREISIRIECMVAPEGLTIEVSDDVPTEGPRAAGAVVEQYDEVGEISLDKQDLGALLMEILVDEVTVDARRDGTLVRLYKRSPENPPEASL